MKSNLSQADKIIRIVLAVSFGIVSIFIEQYWPAIIGLILLTTALINFCPIYFMFGYSSRKFHESPFHAKPKKKNHR